MPEQIPLSDFVNDTWDDFKSPTTSSFTKNMPNYKNLVSNLEERLDTDRSGLTKMKKSVKALYNAGKRHFESDVTMAENLENVSKSNVEQDNEVVEGFKNFSMIARELSTSLNDMVSKLHTMLLYPLEAFLKGDLKGVKGDMKKPFDKATKEYETKFGKIEKEKKQQAKDAGMTRTEVDGSEIAEDMLKERKVFQLQLCEYLIKVNDIKTKKGVELLLHLVEYYKALKVFHQESLESIGKFEIYIEKLISQLQGIKQKQYTDRQQLVELRDALKNSMSSYKEGSRNTYTEDTGKPAANKSPAGYSLHQLHGNKMHGSHKNGYLLKKSDGKVRKVWQKRKCIIQDGIMLVSHSDETKEPVKLNLLTCQVKLVADDVGKKCFDLVSSSNNRTYHFQGEDVPDMEEWISVLNNAKEEVLLKAFQDNTNSPAINQNMKELTVSIIDRIKRLPGNQICCDCGGKDPEWLSTNYGILICLECCGIHRQLGVHISRTQSIVIDELGTSQLLLARVVGNDCFNEVFEGKIFDGDSAEGKEDGYRKLKHSSPMKEREAYIFAKYDKKKFIINTNGSEEEIRYDLKQAIQSRDFQTLLQIHAEGTDLMSVMPDMENGETGLHLAILLEDGYSLYIVDFIIQNSLITNLGNKSQDGNTPLHLCAIEDKTECMKLLLRTCPELAKIENSEGKTPLAIAKEKNNQLCAELLNAALSGRKDLFENVNIDWDLIADDHEHDVDYSDDDLENTPERKRGSRPQSLVTGIPAELAGSLSVPKDGNELRERSDSSVSLQPPKKNEFLNRLSRVVQRKASYGEIYQITSTEGAPIQVTQKKPPPWIVSIKKKRRRRLMHHSSQSAANGGSTLNPVSRDSVAQHGPPVLGVSLPGLGPPLPPRKKPPPPPPATSPGHTRNKSEGSAIGVVHRRSTSDPPPRPAPPDLRNTIHIPSSRMPSLPGDTNNNSRSSRTRIGSSGSGSTDGSPKVPNSPTNGSETPPLPAPRQKKRPPIGQKCQAIYDCDADNEDELTFREGEIIIITGEEEDEWWEGEIEGEPGRRGVFPKTFVSMIT
ncbi:arf-GAP with SH3 domain, ANK repeat and PH domain-containing protein 2-like isoform X3 [Ostrea edulis]|uniref:arf-GAP with SH3 domain, ANK repeat and PH domain-containing protein 2-like isoform X3 n=1 Tax=Ostrea edulis TaxID=37623 RepID=UPI0024AF7342|nr:arf-GAP with SH3 domain, ANK repeat and PH domain-containing protein 2-like isoform X3 [Ostrea edulis]